MDIFSRKRLTGWLIGLLVISNILTLGTLWYRETMRPPFPDRPREADLRRQLEDRFQQELGLDQEQVKQFNEVREEFFSRVQPEKKRIHELNTEIMKESFSPTPNMDKITERANQIAAIEAKLPFLLFDHIRELRQLARPEQQDKLQRFFDELFRHSNPPGPPGPPDGNSPERKSP